MSPMFAQDCQNVSQHYHQNASAGPTYLLRQTTLCDNSFEVRLAKYHRLDNMSTEKKNAARLVVRPSLLLSDEQPLLQLLD